CRVACRLPGPDRRGGNGLSLPALSAATDRNRRGRCAGPASHPPRPRAAIPARGPPRMTAPRKPAAFRLDDPRVMVAPAPEDGSKPRAGRGVVRVMPEPESADITVPAQAPAPAIRRRFPWGTVFWSALGGLVLLGLGLSITNLIQELYARVQWLGA